MSKPKKKKVSASAAKSIGGIKSKNPYKKDLPYSTEPYYYITPWERTRAQAAYKKDVLERKKLAEKTGINNLPQTGKTDISLPPVGKVGFKPEYKNYVNINRIATNLTPAKIRSTSKDELLNTITGYRNKKSITLKEFITFPAEVQKAYGINAELESINRIKKINMNKEKARATAKFYKK